MGAREDFYKTLNDDLIQHGSHSVLYEYLVEEQETRAQTGEHQDSRSYQLRIRYFRRCWMEGSLSSLDYLTNLLVILQQSPKLCKKCGREVSSKEEMNSFLRYGVVTARKQTDYISLDPMPLLQALFSSCGQTVDTNENLSLALLVTALQKKEPKVLTALTNALYLIPKSPKLQLLTDTILDVAIAYDIREFFSSTDVKDSKTKRNKKGQGKRVQRVDKTLCLLDRYCQRKGVSLFQATMSCSASATEYNTLLELLNEKEDPDLFLPIYVDADSGCGIYILGMNYFDTYEQQRIQRKERNKGGSVARNCIFVVTDFEPRRRTTPNTGYIKSLAQYVYNADSTYTDYLGAREDLKLAHIAALDELKSIYEDNGIPEFIHYYHYEEDSTETQRLEERQIEKDTKTHLQKLVESCHKKVLTENFRKNSTS